LTEFVSISYWAGSSSPDNHDGCKSGKTQKNPLAKACFVIGHYTFFPFDKETISRRELSGLVDIGTGALGTLGNVLWSIFAGIWLAIGHVVSALCCFVSIIGIPFGWQHLKLAGIALAPVAAGLNLH
jgi:uncharacterized membrane protein YccF (DUF307 family)